jgi:preprotein translocase subunit SecE
MALGNYLKETREEMRHVSWPTRSQIIGYTLVVIFISALISIYLGVFDYLLRLLIQKVIG